MRIIKSGLAIMTILVLLSGCSAFKNNNMQKKKEQALLTSTPVYPDNNDWQRGYLEKLPVYNPKIYTVFGVDLRSYNLSKLNLKNKYNELIHASFNTKTIWGKTLPESFNPEKVMEVGKNPGLGIKSLHEEGITGKGVGIAIIDQRLLRTHQEYKKQLKLYKEIGFENESPKGNASMHGVAVASIAVGKNCGVAPDADLYYIAANNGKMIDGKFVTNYKNNIKAIKYVLELNKILPENKKIRVISISWGYVDSPDLEKYKDIIQKAKAQGILVVTTNLEDKFKYGIMGLGKKELSDPDKIKSYIPGMFWINALLTNTFEKYKFNIYVPMDCETVASPFGNADYAFYSDGGLSWTAPWLAGMYTLACQVDPRITPEKFLKTVYDTGNPAVFELNGQEYNCEGKIINPKELIKEIKK